MKGQYFLNHQFKLPYTLKSPKSMALDQYFLLNLSSVEPTAYSVPAFGIPVGKSKSLKQEFIISPKSVFPLMVPYLDKWPPFTQSSKRETYMSLFNLPFVQIDIFYQSFNHAQSITSQILFLPHPQA